MKPPGRRDSEANGRLSFSDNTTGAALMSGAALAFVLNDFLMKLVFAELSVVQGVFVRGMMVSPLLLVVCFSNQQLFVRLPRRDRGLVFWRTVLEIAITFCFLLALSELSLAHVTAVLQAVPLILTAIAALVLNEQVGWRRWAAVCTGFVGVMLVIKPGLDGFSLFSLSVLAAAVLIAVRDILTRRLSTKTPSLFVGLVTAVAITVAGGLATLQTGWQAPSETSWLLIAGAALAIPAAYVLSIATMRVGDVSFVTPFRYTAIVFATGLSSVMTGHLPDNLSLAGTAMVIAAGLYCLHREHVLGRGSQEQV